MKSMRKTMLFCLVAASLLGCSDGGGDLHRSILEGDLRRVTYDNGISRIEAKTIGEAYLFVYGGKYVGPAPQVYIHDGGKDWLAAPIGGTGLDPHLTGLPPVHISKADGDVTWADGPSVHRVNLNLAPKKDYFNPSAMPSDAR